MTEQSDNEDDEDDADDVDGDGEEEVLPTQVRNQADVER